MRFTIVKNIGTNQPQQLSYDFIPPGGTIGRSPDNNWVLPDEAQAIARLQAVVSVSTDGECRITNRGSASEILLNAIPMAPERQIEVCNGDVLNIGDYQIHIINTNQSASAPPLAATRPLDANVFDTIRASSGKPENIPNTVWDGLESTFATATSTTSNVNSSTNSQHSSLELNDNNPLTKHQQNQERNPIDPLKQMETTIELNSLQLRATDPMTIFNADAESQQENILTDTTPSTLLQQSDQYSNNKYSGQNDKPEIDPLVLFSDQHIHEIKNDDPLNLILNNAEPLTTEKTTEKITENLTKNITDIVEENVFSSTPSNPHSAHNNNGKRTDKRLDIDPMTYSSNHRQTDDVKLEGKLLAALLDGMGLNHIQSPQFDEHAMYKLGKLLSQLSQGIIALNASRSLLKHLSDMDRTQVMADANNPFKLLPSGQAVLVQMFGDYMPGFMSSEQATRDILVELQAHQLGMIAGLRTIKADILQSFDPSVIEQKVREEGNLPSSLLSSNHKASLWTYFTKSYQKITTETEHDYVMFSKHFRQAYKSEIIRYKDSQDKIKK
ncbi:type VI secretion system-associated FHA domain protein TagH [Xenorhabdus anantnagensis]|uniref:Type VI secretion system-associated FHA domain protein TagH n=1 Tax=Xenorhabdus anantnagensis TaxID=3025875 RepID=A0ABT5LNT6_9GAMM|nr:type VI secretion system-associated FHA domain protein TagH [Xenorhabdus anantnagensis]MDC9595431.1 type VI secretion system-associated FHA domain protein TagH [Xenorhabdus anantnagensis]